jgi:hypothetical protein
MRSEGGGMAKFEPGRAHPPTLIFGLMCCKELNFREGIALIKRDSDRQCGTE